ncbi:ATP-binding protein [Streptomyces albulus]|nr:ATP-binding protein [Streptomyces noursei]
MALHAVPPGWKVTWVPVPVRLSVAGMRRAVFDALALPGRFPHTSALADAAVAEALRAARVLVVDEAQRLPAPCLEYLQSLWDHPARRSRWCCAERAANGRWPGCRSWHRASARGRRFRAWPQRKWRPR